ncbi:unnamed protein product, partial [Ixodes persulcatus]
HREPSRRIGSGRILRDQRDWDRENREYGYGGRRFEDTGHAGGHSGRYGGDRRRGGPPSLARRDERIEEEEEPEWFVGGPTSQHDTIELVGFDEDPEGGRRVGRRSRRSREFARKQQQQQALPTQQNGGARSPEPGQDGPAPTTGSSLTTGGPNPTLPDGLAAPALPSQDGFDLNEIFRADWCPQFLSPLEGPPAGGSRFSQWFRRDSPPPQGDQGGESRRPSSVHDDLMARVLASGSGEGGLRLPSPESYFTPISPALPRDHGSDLHPLYGVHPARPSPPPHHPGQKNILDILLDANIDVEAHLLNGDAHKTAQLREHALSGKAKSVAELEADLKQVVLGGGGKGGQLTMQQQLQRQQQQHQQQQQSQQHLQGLLSKLGGGPGGPPQQQHHHHLQQPIPAVPERALQEEDLLRASYGHPAHNMAMHAGEPQFLPLMQNVKMGQQEWHILNKNYKMKIYSRKIDKSSSNDPRTPMETQRRLRSSNNTAPTGDKRWRKRSRRQLPPTNEHKTPRAAAAAATMLRQQQHHQQQQQQQEMLQSLLKPPLLTTQRPSPTQQLGLLAPGPLVGTSCQSPLPQDPRRVPSPLVFGQHASPIPPAGTPNPMASGQSSNTLQVNTAGLRPRVPSPQELAVHTQSILQTALIKKILEEQKHKENLRKQQEAQRTRSPTLPQQGVGPNRGASPSKGLSPTMATFTPTSVMRKMHLEQRQDHPKGEHPSLCRCAPSS